MLYLVTGLPGSGKTLYTVSWVPQEFEGRPVFYSGIKDLLLPWIECEPDKWMELPDGAVVVIDECQRVFRPRGAGSKVPDFVAALETHRHRGFDIVFITQHPGLLDANVRKLVGHHTHVRRTWGMGTAALFRWMDEGAANPDERADLARAEKVRWQYPKAAFNAYKSAELHTHKVRLPRKVGMAAVIVALVGLAVWRGYHWITSESPSAKANAVKSVAATGGGEVKGKRNIPANSVEWYAERKPLVPEEPASAPRYAELTMPVRAPRIAGCIFKASKVPGDNGICQCFTQQGTAIDVARPRCDAQMAGRVFDDWGPGGESGWQSGVPVDGGAVGAAAPGLPGRPAVGSARSTL